MPELTEQDRRMRSLLIGSHSPSLLASSDGAGKDDGDERWAYFCPPPELRHRVWWVERGADRGSIVLTIDRRRLLQMAHGDVTAEAVQSAWRDVAALHAMVVGDEPEPITHTQT